MMQADADLPVWPPAKRCGNCGWWKANTGLPARIGGISGKLGKCSHPRVDDDTWHSHICAAHTDTQRAKQ